MEALWGSVYSGHMPQSLQEATEQAEALADWFEAEGPSPDNQRPVKEYYLEYISEVRDSAWAEIAELVAAARKAGASWRQVGEVLGISSSEAERQFDGVAAPSASPHRDVESLGLEL